MKSNKERNLGQFYTPTLFVDYAHKMISEQFGEDWKEKFVVWDNCSGTKNLTRDYFFKELYCSTLENAELEISERYNREATAFQFDFLNDSLDKLPQGLKEALENNKPIIFFINPPYAAGGSGKGKVKEKGTTKNLINEEMLKDEFGGSAENLQHQFLYRICKIKQQYNLTNVHIAIFSKPIYLSGGKQAKFLGYLCDNFKFENGVLFNASHFSDVSDKWGITFNIWSCGETEDKHNFIHNLIDNVNGEIEIVDKKNIYNINGEKTASAWVKPTTTNKVLFPNASSAIVVRGKENSDVLWDENSIGYFYNKANNVYKNALDVAFLTMPFFDAHGCSVTKDNFDKCTALFSARKLIVGNWINDKDEYLAPNEDNEHYNEFVNDSIIYSLFHSASNQSSLRQVEYKGKLWDIKNEFFFMSRDEVMDLANENGFDFTYNDAKVSGERYVYEKLQQIDLSKEAQAVLDKATELTINSFKYRELFNDEHSEYQILNWDCGWYQIKGMLKEFMPNEYKEFVELFKALAEKMRPMVYELGFLK